MYYVQVDHVVYVRRPGQAHPRPARPGEAPNFTLAAALAEVYGCANAHILREARDGRLVTVVAHAGRAFSDLVHAPSGRLVRRGAARRPGVTRWSPWPTRVAAARAVGAL